MSLTHYYHGSDNILDEYDDIIYSVSEEIVQEPLELVEDDAEQGVVEKEKFEDIAEGDELDGVASIKSESEIFDLDETEFTIEDITVKDEGAEVEITVADVEPEKPEIKILRQPEPEVEEEKKVTEPQNKAVVIYNDMAAPTLLEAKRVLELRRVAKYMLSLRPKKKFPLSYSSIINPAIINKRSYDPANQHLDTVQYYEEYFQMLFVAIDKKDLRSIESLTEIIGVNSEVYARGLTPLIYAINKGDINIVKKILALGYDPNKKDEVGNAPIHLAVLHGRVDIVVELIKAHADLTIPNAIYKLPLALAIETGNFYMADLLVKAGAVNIKKHKSFKEYVNSKKQYVN